ncbi:velvet factor-domain-containing protein [Mycena capillaripes]|nr:velvet factor-domain-containing protein [Mycena capillaripes]
MDNRAYSALNHYNFAEFPTESPPLIYQAPFQQSGDLYSQYPAHILGTGLIGRTIHFTQGQFAGKTIRATLQELQAPVVGRKTVSTPREAKVDRRPLDPPPVAWLRLFEVFNVGTMGESQTEMNYDNIHLSGLVCTVDLMTSEFSPSRRFDSSSSPAALSGTSHKVTGELAGMTSVQADSIPWKGSTCLLFTFNDLAVKSEGIFLLQYRFFDLFSTASGHADPPIQAECWGAPFRVYSTRETPTLGKSTELSKLLKRYGVPVNARETERKRKKSVQNMSPPYTSQKLQAPPTCDDDTSNEDDE